MSASDESIANQKSVTASRFGDETLNYVLLQFQSPVYCPLSSLIIGSRLELDANESVVTSTNCRIAFFGRIVSSSTAIDTEKLKLFKWKTKEAEILRLTDVKKDSGLCTEAIGWKLFSKEAGIGRYLNMKLETPTGDVVGFVQSPFGSTGKFKIRFPLGVYGSKSGSKLILKYKVYVFDMTKKMNQDSDLQYTPMEQRAISSNPFPLNKDTSLSTAPTFAELEIEESETGAKGFIEADAASDDEAEPKPEEHVALNDIAAELNAVTEEEAAPCSFCALVEPETPQDATNAPAPVAPEADFIADTPASTSVAVAGTGRQGTIESIKPSTEDTSKVTCIVSGAFEAHENIRSHIGATVISLSGDTGALMGPFAKMGKCKVEFNSSSNLAAGQTVSIKI